MEQAESNQCGFGGESITKLGFWDMSRERTCFPQWNFMGDKVLRSIAS
jgi:hypothetical protein